MPRAEEPRPQWMLDYMAAQPRRPASLVKVTEQLVRNSCPELGDISLQDYAMNHAPRMPDLLLETARNNPHLVDRAREAHPELQEHVDPTSVSVERIPEVEQISGLENLGESVIRDVLKSLHRQAQDLGISGDLDVQNSLHREARDLGDANTLEIQNPLHREARDLEYLIIPQQQDSLQDNDELLRSQDMPVLPGEQAQDFEDWVLLQEQDSPQISSAQHKSLDMQDSDLYTQDLPNLENQTSFQGQNSLQEIVGSYENVVQHRDDVQTLEDSISPQQQTSPQENFEALSNQVSLRDQNSHQQRALSSKDLVQSPGAIQHETEEPRRHSVPGGRPESIEERRAAKRMRQHRKPSGPLLPFSNSARVVRANNSARTLSTSSNTAGLGLRETVSANPLGSNSNLNSGQNIPRHSAAESSAAAATQQPISISQTMPTYTQNYQAFAGRPQWEITGTSYALALKQLNKGRVPSQQKQAYSVLVKLKELIDQCFRAPEVPTVSEDKLLRLRDFVHQADVVLEVNNAMAVKARILSENGLPKIFQNGPVDFPWDLKADAFALYLRWYKGNFDVDILRGIVTRKVHNRTSDSLDPAYEHRVSAAFIGDNHLLVGQWWPTQLSAMRDGAHGSSQGGIYGESGKGAYSIVLSGGSGYGDQDDGHTVIYSGTACKPGTSAEDKKPTENTTRLIETCDLIHNPVRVLRSHQLPAANKYRPKIGLRYDGLYDVVSKELENVQTQMYKFRLVRRQHQLPIRYEDEATRRPTQHEVNVAETLKKNGRMN